MTDKRKRDTGELLELLFKEWNLSHFLSEYEEDLRLPSFYEYITALSKKRNEPPSRIICRANIEKSFGYQLFCGKRNPSRDTVLQLAFGFEADIEQAQLLLKTARKSPLYPRVKRDSVIIYCLHHHISVIETQIILDDLKLPTLGGIRNGRD